MSLPARATPDVVRAIDLLHGAMMALNAADGNFCRGYHGYPYELAQKALNGTMAEAGLIPIESRRITEAMHDGLSFVEAYQRVIVGAPIIIRFEGEDVDAIHRGGDIHDFITVEHLGTVGAIPRWQLICFD